MAYLDSASSNYATNAGRRLCRLRQLDSAICVLEELVGRNTTAPVQRRIRHGRMISAAARRRMAAQRAATGQERAQANLNARKKVKHDSAAQALAGRTKENRGIGQGTMGQIQGEQGPLRQASVRVPSPLAGTAAK